MPRKPLVTVLLSACNDVTFLPEAVESVLAQTFGDFEFLVIDDGSNDGSGDYLASLRDPRLRVIRNPQNVGLTRSLNRGLAAAAAPLVARMDADDIALPDRLKQQIDFLRANPHVGVVGSSRTLIDERGAVTGQAPAAETDLAIRWKCLLGNPFAHPTVMLRLDVLDAHGLRYAESFRTAQDYELWTRLLTVTRGANLPEPLLRYRLRDGVSRMHKDEQLRNHDRIAFSAIRRLLPDFLIAQEEVTQLRGRFGGHSVREASMDANEPRWAEKYRLLRKAFVERYGGEAASAAA